MLETFLTVVAWIVVIPCTFIGVSTLIRAATYPGSLDEMMDKVKGVRRIHKPLRFLIIAILAWGWLITTWVS